jgi:hypothetical protein
MDAFEVHSRSWSQVSAFDSDIRHIKRMAEFSLLGPLLHVRLLMPFPFWPFGLMILGLLLFVIGGISVTIIRHTMGL